MLRFRLVAAAMTAAGLSLPSPPALAHCDSVDGPVATAAVRALDAANVNLALPFVPATAGPEVNVAFDQALRVRGLDAAAKALADRWFMETVVRLHRAGEGAPYTGLKPAGTDFGPAIAGAERALDSGDIAPLQTLISETVREAVAARFATARAQHDISIAPATAADVPAARERARAEFAFMEFVEAIRLAAGGGEHGEGAKEATGDGHR
jgi:hypothetical protein